MQRSTQRIRSATTILAATTAAVVLAACGGGEPGSATTTSGNGISVVDNDFDPEHLEVAAGDEVSWTWEGSRPHDVAGDGFQSEVQETGTFSHTFDESGEYDYECTLHGGMTGRVTVVGS